MERGDNQHTSLNSRGCYLALLDCEARKYVPSAALTRAMQEEAERLESQASRYRGLVGFRSIATIPMR